MKALGMPSPRIEGLLMNCDFAHLSGVRRAAMRLKAVLYRGVLASRLFDRVVVIDDIAYGNMRSWCPAGRLVLCPDPVDIPSGHRQVASRQEIGLPVHAKVIGAFGVLTHDKRIDLLVEAFLSRSPAQDEYLLLMGEQKAHLRKKLRQLLDGREEASRVWIVDRFMKDEELLSAINAVDVVAVTYPHHMGSASFLIRATAAGKPVLASNVGWIGYTMNKYRLGRTCDVLDRESLRQGLDWAFNHPQDDCPDAGAFSGQHTIERFQQIVCGDPV